MEVKVMRQNVCIILVRLFAVVSLYLIPFTVMAETTLMNKADEGGTPLKQLAPGTVFSFATKSGNNVDVKIKKMDGVSILQETGATSSEIVGFGITLFGSDDMDDSNREAVTKLYPLKVSNSVSTGFSGKSPNGSQWIASAKITVTGVEKVTVPAGTYDTFVIETKMTSRFWSSQNTCWYAPAIGYCAKRKFNNSKTNLDWELIFVAAP
jgi:hypothetical protein